MEFKLTLKGEELAKVQRLQKRLGHTKVQTTVRFLIKTYELK